MKKQLFLGAPNVLRIGEQLNKDRIGEQQNSLAKNFNGEACKTEVEKAKFVAPFQISLSTTI